MHVCSLQSRGSKLVLLRGPPSSTIAQACKGWGVTRLCFEVDTEPYALARDAEVTATAEAAGIEVRAPVGHTLYDSTKLIDLHGGKPPHTMKVTSAADHQIVPCHVYPMCALCLTST